MERVRMGVIGCGVIGSRNLQDAQESDLIDVVAAADLGVERREWASEQGVPRVYEDGRDLLDEDDEVEAVIIAFPAAARTAMALRAFARGRHVLVEKPVAMNAAEVETMIAARGSLVAGCFSGRYRAYESADVITEFVGAGALGELRELHVRVLLAAPEASDRVPPPWRESFSMNAGGILTNWSCYDLDYILGITGWRFHPRSALAQTWRCAEQFRHHVAPESDADAHFCALVTGDEGVVLSIERAEFAAAATEQAWQIVGTDGSLRMNMLARGHREVIHDEGRGPGGVVSSTLWEGDDSESGGNPRVIEEFARAVRGDGEPITSLEQALVVARITDAVYQSAASGRAVEIV